jgi:N6-L-threonylcarbamoyladenine synthase
MKVLGIETSCDETSVAVVKDGKKILSNKVSSSLHLHRKYGGVVPEIASRMQLEAIAPAAECALQEAGIALEDIGLFSVTEGPGLPGSLLVGLAFARALSLVRPVPCMGVNHIHSHIYANFLGPDSRRIRFPFVALVVSGGHTSLFWVKDFARVQELGRTQDDACGEAFDKVAKILGMGYPGGPLIERMAKKGDPRGIRFNCSTPKQPLAFSFSGIKTAVLYYVNALKKRQGGKLSAKQIADICASFQEAAIDALIQKSFLACEIKKTKRLLVGGGVAANSRLREKFFLAAGEKKATVYFPPVKLCTDNAAMVAGLGYELYRRGSLC